LRVLTITAAHDENGNLVADPGFVVDGKPTPDAPADEPALEVDILDLRGNPLHAARVPWTQVCAPPAEGVRGGTTTVAIGLVRFDRAARGLRMSDGGRVVLERTAPRQRLVADVAWPPPIAPGEARSRRIEWQSAPGTLAAPAFSADDGKTWLPIGLPSAESPLEVDLANLPGSDQGKLRLVVTDGLRTINVDSGPWALPRTGWVGTILTPTDGTAVAAGRMVHLAGQAIEIELRQWADEQLEWHVGGLGSLGRGRQVEVLLPAGSHQVELRLDGRVLASITVRVM
jgi:hypothetical protein